MAMESSSSSKFHSQNLQNLHDFEWPYHEDLFPFDKAVKLPPLEIDGLMDFNNSFPLSPFHWDNDILDQLDNTEIFSPMPIHDDETTSLVAVEEIKPLRMIKLEEEKKDDCEKMKNLRLSLLKNGRRKSSVLELEEIQKHFHIPISEAAKEMNVGLTVLKKRCRELNIMRWPHRKLKSLKSLIQNVKEMGLTNEIKGLEEHKRLVEELPDMDLTYRTKRLRQACFKANYKKKIRFNNHH